VTQAKDLTERIQQYIVERNMRPGERLPSERSLSEQLAASRSSVREALRQLEALGIVEKQPRSGTYVRAVSVNALAPIANGWRALSSESVHQIFEMRMLFEPGCASLAAVRAAEDDLMSLRKTIQAMEAAANHNDAAAFQQADAAFHQAITRATRNPHLIHLIQGVMNALRQSIEFSLHVPGQMERALAGHRQILVAIEHRQTEWAAAAMETHLRDAWHYISQQIAADAEAENSGSLS
jgi:GntR family transcriptional repressor for pyruvate dehydrogenase complex